MLFYGRHLIVRKWTSGCMYTEHAHRHFHSIQKSGFRVVVVCVMYIYKGYNGQSSKRVLKKCITVYYVNV